MKKIIGICMITILICFLSACQDSTLLTTTTILPSYTTTSSNVINLDLNGGSGQEIICIVSDTIYLSYLPKPTKDNDTFIGWFFDKGCRDAAKDKLINVVSGLTLYAGWDKQIKTSAFLVGSIPRIDINTLNNSSVVSKEIYIDGTFSLTDADNPENNLTNKGIKMKVRGNSSADSSYGKLSYKVKFSSKTNISGFGSAKDWGLISNHMDYSMMRNFMAYRLASLLKFEYPIDCKYCEVYLNGDYRGLYLLTELVETGTNRVNIEDYYDKDSPETPFLLEIDIKVLYTDLTKEKDIDYFINSSSIKKLPFSTKFPVDFTSSSITTAQYDYIKTSVSELYSIVSTPDYANLIDLDSFIDYFIMQELFKNVDMGSTSVYFYRIPGEKIKFGPLWDMDITLGNYKQGENASSYEFFMKDFNGGNYLFNTLLENSSFLDMFKSRYEEIMVSYLPYLLSSLDQIQYDIFDAQKRNNIRWNVLGTSINDLYVPDWIVELDTFEEQKNYLKTFLTNRANWISEELGLTARV